MAEGEAQAFPGLAGAFAYPRFAGTRSRVLFMDAHYYLAGELKAAARCLGHELLAVDYVEDVAQFLTALLQAAVAFRPDYLLTVNHAGFNPSGRLTRLLERFNLPSASWFVDSPRLIMGRNPNLGSPLCAVFTWDRHFVGYAHEIGFPRAAELPLASDFDPPRKIRSECDVCFVGSSLAGEEERALAELRPTEVELRVLGDLAREVDHATVDAVVRNLFPDRSDPWHRAAERLVLMVATREYRSRVLRSLAGFDLRVYGDEGWRGACPRGAFRGLFPYARRGEAYGVARVNLNISSVQLVHSVNQRVFDVPACGALLATDRPASLEGLFSREAAPLAYASAEALPAVLADALRTRDTAGRARAHAGRAEIVQKHRYTHRFATLDAHMREWFGA